MVDETKIKHIEVRTMASDQNSIRDRGGYLPVPYVPGPSGSAKNEEVEKTNTSGQSATPKPPEIE